MDFLFEVIMFQNRLEMTKGSWPFELLFLFTFQVYMPFVNWWPSGKRGMFFIFFYHRNELLHTFHTFFFPIWACGMMNLLVFVWMFVCVNPFWKELLLQLVVYVIPHFWKTSSIFWEQIRPHLLKKHLGRGEEDPAFFQLLENHTEDNLKLNLVSIWWWVHCRFPFSFCCSDIQLLCKWKCTINLVPLYKHSG